MVNVRGIARLGTLAVGLGLGAAWAHTPVASADSSTDLFSWPAGPDLGDLSAAALPAAPTLDLAISFDGVSLFQEGSATAATKTGEFALAIASGAGSDANNNGAEFDSAFAVGANSTADAGILGTGDFAFADGANSTATAGDGYFDAATIVGANGSA